MAEPVQPLQGAPVARVAVLGASGFAGALCAWLTWRHPRLELCAATSRSDAGVTLESLYPRYRVPIELTEPDMDRLGEPDSAFVAYPHGAAAPVVAELLERGVRVVDLSADFRLHDPETYRAWYGEHVDPGLLGEAAYGLTELHRETIATSRLVANPGCYPTATILGLAPLAEAGLISEAIVDAKSGVSGAGRGGGDSTHFVTVDENVYPYKTAGHRHEPEIAQELSELGAEGPLSFVPHLLPLDQGELCSCYVRPTRAIDADELSSLYRDRYAEEAFVEVTDGPPGVREVRDTNYCRIHATVNGRSGLVMVFAAIDNLWKGAASQAVQNLNLMLGLPESEGVE